VKQADSIALKPGAHREIKLQLNNAAGGRLKRSPDRRQFCFISVLFHEDISLHPSPRKGKIIYLQVPLIHRKAETSRRSRCRDS